MIAARSDHDRFPYLRDAAFAEPNEHVEEYMPGRFADSPSPRQILARKRAIDRWKIENGIPPGAAWGDGRSRPPGSA
jgi:hypothetical protein